MKLKAVVSIISLLIALPIWYYLMYQILVRVNASELMFFLYWVYVPIGIVGGIISKVVED